MDKVRQAMKVTLSGFESSLERHMPDGLYRDFYLWALRSDDATSSTWYQVVGIPQFVNLTVKLLADLVDEEDWHKLVEFSAPMNSYLIYETVSDNLAIGLEPYSRLQNDHTKSFQREILYTFNNAAITRLEDSSLDTTQLLQPIEPLTRRVSSFAQSLTQEELYDFAMMYVSQRGDIQLDDLEFGEWPALVANIEACRDAADLIKDNLLGKLMRNGLTWRYQAVNRLLSPGDLLRSQIVHVSTYAILVIPVLAYYISVLIENVRPNPNLKAVVENAQLAKVLYDAALLVRLLNDLGTQLLKDINTHSLLFDRLAMQSRKSGYSHSFYDLLAEVSGELPFLTRIRKDILHGEFNISLYNTQDSFPRAAALHMFSNNLSYFSKLYLQKRAHMVERLEAISQLLGDETASKLIYRFVAFHERLYDNRFDSQLGDYATKPVA